MEHPCLQIWIWSTILTHKTCNLLHWARVAKAQYACSCKRALVSRIGLILLHIVRAEPWVTSPHPQGCVPLQPAVDKCWPTSAARMTTWLTRLASLKSRERAWEREGSQGLWKTFTTDVQWYISPRKERRSKKWKPGGLLKTHYYFFKKRAWKHFFPSKVIFKTLTLIAADLVVNI